METLNTGTKRLLELLGHDEEPFGVYYTDVKPEGGYGPKPGEILTRERELAGEIDWQKVFQNFTCLMGSLWLARKKQRAAWISREEYGCMGGGYFTGQYSPCLDMNVLYVSTGIPGTQMEGEHYMPSPESMRKFLDDCAPPPASAKYCVLKPLGQFIGDEKPLSVTFFARPEVMTGLHSLVGYATGNHNAVVSPFGAGCTSIVSWPLAYAQRGLECAVLGGFDPSARKFMKTDELTLSMPLSLYQKMLAVMESSALPRETWQNTRKKVTRSARAWGEK